MDREDRWDIYIAKRLRREKDKLGRINSLVKIFVSMLEPPEGRLLLDLGCGLGRHMHFAADKGFKVVGCDISPKTLEVAEDLARAKELAMEFVQCDFLDLPFNNNVFSGVVAIDAIHHDFLENILSSLREVHRVLAPGGLICLNPLSTRDNLNGRGRKLGDRLYVIHRIPHYFFTAEEVRFILEKSYFQILQMEIEGYTQQRDGEQVYREKFHIIAKKQKKTQGQLPLYAQTSAVTNI